MNNRVNQSEVTAWGDNQDRFIMVFDDVWELIKGTSSLSVYMALKRRVQGDGDSWFSTRETLAKEAGVSPKTFDRAVDNLEEMMLVQSTMRFVPKDWDRRDESKISNTRDDDHPVQIGNLYRVRFRTVGKNDQTPSSKRPDPLGNFDQTPSSNLGNRHISHDIDTKTNNPPNPQGDDGLDRFDEFWETYSHKKNRGGAERAWKKAIKHTDPQDIINAAKLFIASQKSLGKHPQYTPYPSTWLNGKRWLDDVEPPEDLGGFGYDISFDD